MAAMQNKSVDDLFRSLEISQEQYLKNLRELHETIHRARSPSITRSHRIEGTGSSDRAPASPAIRAGPLGDSTPLPVPRATFASDVSVSPGDGRPRRLTNELADRTRLARLNTGEFEGVEWEVDDEHDRFIPLPLLPPSQTQGPPPTGEPSCWPRVQRLLESRSYRTSDLVRHLQQLPDDSETTVAALGDVFARRKELNTSTVFTPGPDPLIADNESATYEVYDINTEGLAVARHDDMGSAQDEVLDAADVWRTVKEVNLDKSTVGRITIFQEATPAMLAGIHLAMSPHFDMDELFSHLVAPHGETTAHMDRAGERDPIRQRSFFFVFKYYTVVGEGLTPAPWQQYDHRPSDAKPPDHIHITECSSVLALSLEGEPVGEVSLRRGRRRGPTAGVIYDTFAPFHLLNIQCFPDHIHSENSSIKKPCYYNGPYVFLNRLVAEYRDATKRYLQLNDRIRKLITPPYQFMFDGKLRDRLLFEDADFTFSRRYFWAYNSLGVVNDGMKSMISALTDTFTPEFWDGRHPTLWPYPHPGPDGGDYRAQMDALRRELEQAADDLKAVVQANEQVRREIVSLREQLFSGSSVKESRRAIEQGDNIRILTGVSMLFLPLTFVTSVFGITEFTIPADDWRFPVTMVSVCVPFFVLTFVLQTRAGMRAVKRLGDLAERGAGWLGAGAGGDRDRDRAHARHERRLRLRQQLVRAAEESRRSAVSSLDDGDGAGAGGGRVSLRRRGARKGTQGEDGAPGLACEVVVQPTGSIDGRPGSDEKEERWWGRVWRRERAGDMLGGRTGSNV